MRNTHLRFGVLDHRYRKNSPNEIAFNGDVCGQLKNTLEGSQLSTSSGCSIGKPVIAGCHASRIDGFEDFANFRTWIYRCAAFIQFQSTKNASEYRAIDLPVPWHGADGQSNNLIQSPIVPHCRFEAPIGTVPPSFRRKDKLLRGEEVEFLEISALLLEMENTSLKRWDKHLDEHMFRRLQGPYRVTELWEANRSLAVVQTPRGKLYVEDVVRQGDAVCVLHSAPFPFVLRQQRASAGYHLIGDAYFHWLEDTMSAERPPGEWIKLR